MELTHDGIIIQIVYSVTNNLITDNTENIFYLITEHLVWIKFTLKIDWIIEINSNFSTHTEENIMLTRRFSIQSSFHYTGRFKKTASKQFTKAVHKVLNLIQKEMHRKTSFFLRQYEVVVRWHKENDQLLASIISFT